MSFLQTNMFSFIDLFIIVSNFFDRTLHTCLPRFEAFWHLATLFHFCVQEWGVRRHQLCHQDSREFHQQIQMLMKVNVIFACQPYLCSLPNAIVHGVFCGCLVAMLR